MSAHDKAPSPLRRWLSTLPILVVLMAVLVQWTGSQLQSKVIQAGEGFWPGYGSELRREPVQPTPPVPPKETPAAGEGVDQDLIGDLLGDDTPSDAQDDGVDQDLIGDLLGDEASDPTASDPKASDPGGIDEDLIGDLLADEPEEAAADGIDEDLIGDLLADADEDAEGVDQDLIGDLLGDSNEGVDQDLIGDLLGEPKVDPAQERYARQLESYEREQERVSSILERRSEGVQRFAVVDLALESFVGWVNAHIKHLFVLLLALAAVTTTWTRHHIALRNIHGPRGDRISAASQLVANVLVLVSLFAQRTAWEASGILPDHPGLSWIWIATFVIMSVGNVYHLAKPMEADGKEEDSWGTALLAVPLYATMALLSAGWFFIGEGYFAGLAVYLDKLTEHAQLYLQVGLYVWAGMLLKRTSLAHRSFDVLRPWGLPPELLAIVVVLASAIPTAYSGASGIFVIAVGAIVFQELRAAGARKSLAMASAAMSGSLGVVLRPCLLVVIVAYLNPVSSDALFGWGRWVFLLTAGLFALVAFLTRQGPWTLKKVPDAGAKTLIALKGLGLFVGLFVVVILGYLGVLEVGLDQHSAPMILPVILVLMLVLDRVLHKRGQTATGQAGDTAAATPTAAPKVRLQLEAATSEAAVHIGALLLLMGMSVCLGGLVERAELMSVVPASFDSPWAAMALLVALLVVVGMTMDPYGAVILVSATLADVAIASGIDPVHFWMVVLVAFELGYLTPPVALNHLLVRQVVSEIEDPGPEDPPPTNFWQKHERILLPVTVMAIALVLVAFVPLALAG